MHLIDEGVHRKFRYDLLISLVDVGLLGAIRELV
jgi:hypothetical protein